MNLQTRDIKGFFYSQYFSDGLRISLGILLPALVFVYFDMLDTGLTLSLGALCVCVVDTPGPVRYKVNSMIVCNISIFVVAVITSFARLNLYTMGAEIVIFCFLFSMFTVYGNRAASIGTASLLIMVFMMDKDVKPDDIWWYCGIISLGGIWYLIQSLLFLSLRPYRMAQQALGENMQDVVKFLRIKADFYKADTDIDENYRKLVSTQVQVSQHQDVVREILFKSRLVTKESTYASRLLVMTFVDLVDLFEQIMATHYDYADIRERFAHTGVLDDVNKILQRMADQLDNIGFAILSNSRYKHLINFDKELEQLKVKIDEVGQNDQAVSNLALKKVLINLRDLNRRISDIFNYYNSKSSRYLLENRSDVEYSRFVNHQDYTPQIFLDNLSLNSAAFKHALRVSLVCIVGFMLVKSGEVLVLAEQLTGRHLAFGHHSYWVLLTIIVILKPGYSLSKQRNIQRLIGTVAGGIIGLLVLFFVRNPVAQFMFLAVFMMGTYSFVRLNYVVSVIFMTPYVLILFQFLGVGRIEVLKERIADTGIGSIIAFIASYLLFPAWESDQLKESMRQVINANTNYLARIGKLLSGDKINVTEHKLARKEVYVTSANLAAAFERMMSEPKSKQRNTKDVHKFVVLNHILSSYLATIASADAGKSIRFLPEHLKLLKRGVNTLNETAKLLLGNPIDVSIEKTLAGLPEGVEPNADEKLLREQLGFVHKVTTDIAKVTESYLK